LEELQNLYKLICKKGTYSKFSLQRYWKLQ
jgi:hypothetical protein